MLDHQISINNPLFSNDPVVVSKEIAYKTLLQQLEHCQLLNLNQERAFFNSEWINYIKQMEIIYSSDKDKFAVPLEVLQAKERYLDFLNKKYQALLAKLMLENRFHLLMQAEQDTFINKRHLLKEKYRSGHLTIQENKDLQHYLKYINNYLSEESDQTILLEYYKAMLKEEETKQHTTKKLGSDVAPNKITVSTAHQNALQSEGILANLQKEIFADKHLLHLSSLNLSLGWSSLIVTILLAPLNLYKMAHAAFISTDPLPKRILNFSLASTALTITVLAILVMLGSLTIAAPILIIAGSLNGILANTVGLLTSFKARLASGNLDDASKKKLNNEILEKLHIIAQCLLALAGATLLFTPAAPVGILILAATASYGILDILKLNPIKLMLNLFKKVRVLKSKSSTVLKSTAEKPQHQNIKIHTSTLTVVEDISHHNVLKEKSILKGPANSEPANIKQNPLIKNPPRNEKEFLASPADENASKPSHPIPHNKD